MTKTKKSLLMLLCVLFVTPMVALASFDATETMEPFSSELLPSDITYAEAVEQFPEIYETYYIDPVSEEDALALIAGGVECIVIDADISAQEFLSALNARRDEVDRDALEVIVADGLPRDAVIVEPFASSYGAAWAYKSNTSTSVNCYGYAMGMSFFGTPGDFTGNPINRNSSLSTAKSRIISDQSAIGGGGREIASHTASINSNEWRIAFRTGDNLVYVGGQYQYIWDFHFMLQTNTGGWCHKPGGTPSANLGNIIPHGVDWPLYDNNNFYNSSTVYFALK